MNHKYILFFTLLISSFNVFSMDMEKTLLITHDNSSTLEFLKKYYTDWMLSCKQLIPYDFKTSEDKLLFALAGEICGIESKHKKNIDGFLTYVIVNFATVRTSKKDKKQFKAVGYIEELLRDLAKNNPEAAELLVQINTYSSAAPQADVDKLACLFHNFIDSLIAQKNNPSDQIIKKKKRKFFGKG